MASNMGAAQAVSIPEYMRNGQRTHRTRSRFRQAKLCCKTSKEAIDGRRCNASNWQFEQYTGMCVEQTRFALPILYIKTRTNTHHTPKVMYKLSDNTSSAHLNIPQRGNYKKPWSTVVTTTTTRRTAAHVNSKRPRAK